ncbi:MAG: hypothetical protein ACT4PG_10855 [Panacagrimonas sp.]
MKLDTLSNETPSVESRLRKAAALLMSLPATVAAACFAHGHGAVGSLALLAVLAAAIAAGGYGAYLLLSLVRKSKPHSHTNSNTNSNPALSAAPSTTI